MVASDANFVARLRNKPAMVILDPEECHTKSGCTYWWDLKFQLLPVSPLERVEAQGVFCT